MNLKVYGTSIEYDLAVITKTPDLEQSMITLIKKTSGVDIGDVYLLRSDYDNFYEFLELYNNKEIQIKTVLGELIENLVPYFELYHDENSRYI